MAGDSSTATSRPANPARGRLAAPAPAPTSRTVPPSGRERAASRFEGVAGRDPARRARDRNSPTGYPQGDSGAAARISAGDRPAVQLLAPPLQGARSCPSMGGRLPRPGHAGGAAA